VNWVGEIRGWLVPSVTSPLAPQSLNRVVGDATTILGYDICELGTGDVRSGSSRIAIGSELSEGDLLGSDICEPGTGDAMSGSSRLAIIVYCEMGKGKTELGSAIRSTSIGSVGCELSVGDERRTGMKSLSEPE